MEEPKRYVVLRFLWRVGADVHYFDALVATPHLQAFSPITFDAC